MEQYSQNQYTETVRQSALRLQDEGLTQNTTNKSKKWTLTSLAIPKFVARAKRLVSEIISLDKNSEVWTNTRQNYITEMMDACQLIQDGVRDIRNSLTMNRNPDEEVDSENKHEGS